MKIGNLAVIVPFSFHALFFRWIVMAKAEGMEAVATEGVDAGVDTMEVTEGVMEGVGVIIMDIPFPEPSVMAMVLMPTRRRSPCHPGAAGERCK